MTAYILGVLAVAVFGVFWLGSEDWFDLLPRRITRRVGTVLLAVLLTVSVLAPSAFRQGVNRYAAWSATRYQQVIDRLLRQVETRRPVTPAPSGSQTCRNQ